MDSSAHRVVRLLERAHDSTASWGAGAGRNDVAEALLLGAPERMRRPFSQLPTAIRTMIRTDPERQSRPDWLRSAADPGPAVSRLSSQSARGDETDLGRRRGLSNGSLTELTEAAIPAWGVAETPTPRMKRCSIFGGSYSIPHRRAGRTRWRLSVKIENVKVVALRWLSTAAHRQAGPVAC
jgi:hypothetical protein